MVYHRNRGFMSGPVEHEFIPCTFTFFFHPSTGFIFFGFFWARDLEGNQLGPCMHLPRYFAP